MKACVLIQNTHMAKSHTQSCFCFAKGTRQKNTTIKIAFIVWIYAFLAAAESHVLFVSGGLALINTTTDLENELPETRPAWLAFR